MSGWIGAAISGVGSLLGSIGQGRNIDKQIRAQQEENRKNREYNFMLAQQQNKWSVEQWERENEYNSPTNQMARLKNAGINPNFAYSNGVHNISASSPSMTAGAPGTPADMSALGQKPTLGQAIQMALASEATRAQIDNINADTRKTLADAGISEKHAKYLDTEKELGIKIQERVYEKLEHEIDKAYEEAKQAGYIVEHLNYQQLNERLEYLYKEREMEAIIKRLENEADISEQEAKFAIQSFTYRLMGIKAEGELAKFNASMHSKLEDLFGDDADTAAIILQGINYLIGNANNIAKFAGNKKTKK